MVEKGLEIEKFATVPLVFAGGEMRRLASMRKKVIAEKVHIKLTKHPNTMIQYSVVELEQSIEGDRAACVLDLSGRTLAFAQYWPYEIDNTGDEFMKGLNVFEIGSLIGFARDQEKGHGKKVLEACLAVARSYHPEAGFISIVEEGNDKARGILGSIGEKIGEKYSKKIKGTADNPAKMIIYRLN